MKLSRNILCDFFNTKDKGRGNTKVKENGNTKVTNEKKEILRLTPY